MIHEMSQAVIADKKRKSEGDNKKSACVAAVEEYEVVQRERELTVQDDVAKIDLDVGEMNFSIDIWRMPWSEVVLLDLTKWLPNNFMETSNTHRNYALKDEQEC